MLEKKVIINNPTGLHARPANDLCKLATSFKCKTILVKGEMEADAKSILNIIVAAIKCGTEIIVRTDGEDEATALAQLVSFIENLDE
jgi:phosphocarrier protein HPr